VKTYPLYDDRGGFNVFAIPHYFLLPGSAARYFSKMDDVEITFSRRFLKGGDIHAEFIFEGMEFEVVEPFGDNSRLWVGPKSGYTVQHESLRKLLGYCNENWPGPISRLWERVWRL